MEQQFLQNSLWDTNHAQRVPLRQKQQPMMNEQTSFMDFISDRQPRHVDKSLDDEVAYYNYNVARQKKNSATFDRISAKRPLLPVKNEIVNQEEPEIDEEDTEQIKVLKSKEYHGAPLYGWVALGFAVTSILLLVIAFKVAAKAKYILIAVGATLLVVSSIFVGVFIFDKYYNKTDNEQPCCGKKQAEKKLKAQPKTKPKKKIRFQEPPTAVEEEDWEEESKYRRMVLERRRLERDNHVRAVRNAEAMEQEGLNYFPSKIRKEHFPPQQPGTRINKQEYDRYLEGLHGIAQAREPMSERYMPPVHHQRNDPPSGARDWEDNLGIKSQPSGHMMNHRQRNPVKNQVPGKQYVPQNEQLEQQTIAALQQTHNKGITDTLPVPEAEGTFTPITVETSNENYQTDSRAPVVAKDKEEKEVSNFRKLLDERKKMNEAGPKTPEPSEAQKKIDLASLSPWMQPVATGKKAKNKPEEETRPEMQAPEQQIDLPIPEMNDQQAEMVAQQLMKKYQNNSNMNIADNAFGAHFGTKIWDGMAQD
jgi:hypothetical protein